MRMLWVRSPYWPGNFLSGDISVLRIASLAVMPAQKRAVCRQAMKLEGSPIFEWNLYHVQKHIAQNLLLNLHFPTCNQEISLLLPQGQARSTSPYLWQSCLLTCHLTLWTSWHQLSLNPTYFAISAEQCDELGQSFAMRNMQVAIQNYQHTPPGRLAQLVRASC